MPRARTATSITPLTFFVDNGPAIPTLVKAKPEKKKVKKDSGKTKVTLTLNLSPEDKQMLARYASSIGTTPAKALFGLACDGVESLFSGESWRRHSMRYGVSPYNVGPYFNLDLDMD